MPDYSDIIEHSRPITTDRPMSLDDRAAQFMPFAALDGHRELIEEDEIEANHS